MARIINEFDLDIDNNASVYCFDFLFTVTS